APTVEVYYESSAKQGEYRARDAFGNESVRVVAISIKAAPVLKVPTEIPAKVQPTYINTILLVNKTYAIPQDYVSPQKGEAYARLQEMLMTAAQAGHPIALLSGYRSYQQQATLFQKYVNTHGLANAQMFSARPGHSEHQSGLGYDIGSISNAFAETTAYAWLQENAASYGFIERYPNGKTHITGYVFEPWHYRYVGVLHAQAMKAKALTLEEYLGVV
ncbi:MAG: M15 family metallopeptidase, partial [Erysipelotrichaceae bacterium]